MRIKPLQKALVLDWMENQWQIYASGDHHDGKMLTLKVRTGASIYKLEHDHDLMYQGEDINYAIEMFNNNAKLTYPQHDPLAPA